MNHAKLFKQSQKIKKYGPGHVKSLRFHVWKVGKSPSTWKSEAEVQWTEDLKRVDFFCQLILV